MAEILVICSDGAKAVVGHRSDLSARLQEITLHGCNVSYTEKHSTSTS